MLRRAERLTDIAEQVVTHLPKSKAMRDAVRARRPRQGARRLREALLRPLRHVHRDRGRLHRRPHPRPVRVAHRRRQGDVPVRRGDGRLEVLPAGRALPGGHAVAARAVDARPAAAERVDPKSARSRWSRSSTWRARSSRRTWSSPTCGRGWPTSRPRSGRASSRACSAASPATCRSTGATGATSCARSSAGTRARASRASTGSIASHVARVHAAEGERRPRSAGSGSTGRPGHRTILITAAAEPFVRPLCARCSTW